MEGNEYACGWKEVKAGCARIFSWAQNKGFKYVVGLPRGGLVIAVVFSHLSGISLKESIVPFENVLVVDETCHTGKTIQRFKESLLNSNAFKFKTAVLFCNTKAKHFPDYCAFETDAEKITFPWYACAETNERK